MIRDTSRVHGEVYIVLRGADGAIKELRRIRNLVVNKGLEYIVSRMVGASKNVMSHMAIGTGTTGTAPSDTALQSQLGSRIVLDSTTITGTNNEKVVYVATFAAGVGTGSVTEAGIFNAAASGDMLNRVVFNVINKGVNDTLVITWTVELLAI